MVKFSVKNIQVGQPKNNNEKRNVTDENIFFFILNVFDRAKKSTNMVKIIKDAK